MARRIRTRGPQRMRELGHTSVTLWLHKNEIAALGAALERWEKRASFCKAAVLTAIADRRAGRTGRDHWPRVDSKTVKRA